MDILWLFGKCAHLTATAVALETELLTGVEVSHLDTGFINFQEDATAGTGHCGNYDGTVMAVKWEEGHVNTAANIKPATDGPGDLWWVDIPLDIKRENMWPVLIFNASTTATITQHGMICPTDLGQYVLLK